MPKGKQASQQKNNGAYLKVKASHPTVGKPDDIFICGQESNYATSGALA